MNETLFTNEHEYQGKKKLPYYTENMKSKEKRVSSIQLFLSVEEMVSVTDTISLLCKKFEDFHF